MTRQVSGFSKLSKTEKIDWLAENYFSGNPQFKTILKSYWNTDKKLQQLHDEFIENTISNFYLPFAVAPNFLINGKFYTVPMVIEESSVVAAAGNAAKFWAKRGGFTSQVISTQKNGQVHLNFSGKKNQLLGFFEEIKPALLASVTEFSKRMKERGGGIVDIQLVDKTEVLDNYYYLHATFETADAMGANFINTCLEQYAQTFKNLAAQQAGLESLEIVMSILSNYVPECLVRVEATCEIEKMGFDSLSGKEFSEKIVRAVAIAKSEPRRAVTHNKGIMNGIDAVILATGNDFRAIEAGIHAYAARKGHYAGLTDAKISHGQFHFSMEIPLPLGTVGGLTNLHPMVKLALGILEYPNATQLMQIVACVGLAQNFAALKSLVTNGIQQGHMKMHLNNILNQLDASNEEKQIAIAHFGRHKISHRSVSDFVEKIRKESL